TIACPQDLKSSQDDGFQPLSDSRKKVDGDPSKGSKCRDQEQDDNVNSTNNVNAASTNRVNDGNPQMNLQDKRVIDNGWSRHMTGNMSYLTDYEEIDEEYVAFRGNPKGGKITGE
nr:hypothetical protein [Tanacetum cinerariifolium]